MKARIIRLNETKTIGRFKTKRDAEIFYNKGRCIGAIDIRLLKKLLKKRQETNIIKIYLQTKGKKGYKGYIMPIKYGLYALAPRIVTNGSSYRES